MSLPVFAFDVFALTSC